MTLLDRFYHAFQ